MSPSDSLNKRLGLFFEGVGLNSVWAIHEHYLAVPSKQHIFLSPSEITKVKSLITFLNDDMHLTDMQMFLSDINHVFFFTPYNVTALLIERIHSGTHYHVFYIIRLNTVYSPWIQLNSIKWIRLLVVVDQNFLDF